MIKEKHLLLRFTLGWSIAAILGLSGILLLQIPGFPKMIAAQVTAGIIGVAGGFSYTSFIKAMGRKISFRDRAFLLSSWALSFILAVTMLFLVSGPTSMMMVFTFYSFAAWGILGGFVTGRVLKAVFDEIANHDLLPSLVIWSLCLGIAVAASNAVGDFLKMFLPEWLAWALAYEAMAVIIGCGGAYAVIQLFKPTKPLSCSYTEEGKRLYIVVLILLCLPFYLNDLADIYIKDWHLWLFIDYVCAKLFPLLIIGWLIWSRKMKPAEFGLTQVSAISFLSVFLAGTLTGIFLDQNGYAMIKELPGYQALGAMPKITNPSWMWIDVTAGLLFVSIVEELIFRGYMYTFLSHYTKRAAVIIGISALAFGLIHWSGGFHKVVVAAIIGAVFMALFLRTRSLPALVLAHFIIDLVAFTDIVPKSVLRFF
ncbi:MAG: hypothetical protein CSYNP_03334 [Syntrophus sp. SKADARSKE-3]|nr:hypothetical protein [Syntrophus sp. SKADARSKE-3]